ncbi:MAG: hypothetical protein AAGA30_20840, partial [Planctomycetota bacterium]
MSFSTPTSTSEFTLILAAHGSSKAAWNNRPLVQLAEQLQLELPNSQIMAAFLDGTPDIRTIMDSTIHQDVLAIPFMTSQGYYSDVVFPKHLQSASKSVSFAQPIGHHDKLPELVHRRIQRYQQTICGSSQVVVVGHGTKKNRKSCLTTIDLVKSLRRLNPDLRIDFVFIDQNPDLDWYVGQVDSENVL